MTENVFSIVSAAVLIGVAAWSFANDARVSRRLAAANRAANDSPMQGDGVDPAYLGAECRRILRLAAQLGPDRSDAAVGAVNLAGLAAGVTRYAQLVERHSGAFGAPFARAGKALCFELATALEALSAADTLERRRAAGKRLAGVLGAFLPLTGQAAPANHSAQVQAA